MKTGMRPPNREPTNPIIQAPPVTKITTGLGVSSQQRGGMYKSSLVRISAQRLSDYQDIQLHYLFANSVDSPRNSIFTEKIQRIYTSLSLIEFKTSQKFCLHMPALNLNMICHRVDFAPIHNAATKVLREIANRLKSKHYLLRGSSP
jgi:hypothetical protein